MNFETDILNQKNATRNMSDEEFEKLLPWMAEELSKIDFHYNYSDDQLKKAWTNLKNYNTSNHYTASQTRRGMELCEYFFPNFFDIKNKKGKGFTDFWNEEDLQKVIKWNRSSHSTPYLSEFRRGIYFCYGLTKNTMFRPHLAKMICDYYKPKIVLDPCCGWGGRLLGTVASGAHYIGFEPCTETYNNLLRLVDFLDISDNVTIYNIGAESIKDYDIKADLILTSPPYYDLEIYSDESTQSYVSFSTYKEWKEGWLKPIVLSCLDCLNDEGVSCWNVAPNMRDDITEIHQDRCVYDSDFGLQSSARQANQNVLKDKKTKDVTICYRKIN